MNTRRYPRSLSDAFPDERANAITGYRRERHHGIVVLVILAIAVLALAL